MSSALIETSWSSLRLLPKRFSFPMGGLMLSLLAPFGLLLAHAVATARFPTFTWVRADLSHLPVTFGYVLLSAASLFFVVGYLLGRKFDRLLRLSITDPLTGLYNRRYFNDRLTAEIRRGHRYRHETSVLCIDIDRLKALNDLFGHRAGDQALLAVGRALTQNVRGMDAVARIGGDEFAVLLPETSANQAAAFSQRLVERVALHREASAQRLSLSIGIFALNGAIDEPMDAADVIAAADAALYRAKGIGGGVSIVERSASAVPSTAGNELGRPADLKAAKASHAGVPGKTPLPAFAAAETAHGLGMGEEQPERIGHTRGGMTVNRAWHGIRLLGQDEGTDRRASLDIRPAEDKSLTRRATIALPALAMRELPA